MHTLSNPVVAELWRGDGVESIHRGAWAVVDNDGNVIDARGDANQLIYARSSTKSMQALPLIETGAADNLDVTDEELAVAISSHNGEPIHVAAVRSLLARAGLTEEDLRCGFDRPAGAGSDVPVQRVAHNCSGKHAGFLVSAVALGDRPDNYLNPDCAEQQQVKQTLMELTGVAGSDLSSATDGCSAPTFRLPLRALATGLARVTNPEGLEAGRANACRRIVGAAAKHPEMVAGTAVPRFDTNLLRTTGGRLFSKGGAEAVQTVGIVGAGIGFAAKIDDGSPRCLARLTVTVLSRLGYLSSAELAELKRWHEPVRRNADGLEIGRIRIPDDIVPASPKG